MFKMAFRNLFRSSKRTFLTTMVICIGIAGIVFGINWIRGIRHLFTDEGIRMTGEVRITAPEYELKSKMMDLSSNINYQKVEKIANEKSKVDIGVGRINFGGVIYSKDADERGLGIGIEKEDYKTSGLQDSIYKGRFFSYDGENEVIVGNKLRESLNLNLNDQITVVTSTQHRSISADNYEVVGFYKKENSRLNNNIYMPLESVQYLLDMDGRVSEYLLFLNNREDSKKVKEELLEKYDNYAIKTWKELGINSYIAKGFPIIEKIIIGIFIILAGVGISNTMMMIVFERRKEIGILKANGMTNWGIISLFCLEGSIIGVVGSAVGVFLGGSLSYYFSKNGFVVGDVMENISDQINISTTVYTEFSYKVLEFGMIMGILVSIIATYLVIFSEVLKSPVENMRNE